MWVGALHLDIPMVYVLLAFDTRCWGEDWEALRTYAWRFQKSTKFVSLLSQMDEERGLFLTFHIAPCPQNFKDRSVLVLIYERFLYSCPEWRWSSGHVKEVFKVVTK